MRYVAIDREDLAELRRLAQKVNEGEDDSEVALLDFITDMEVIKLTAAVEREQTAGNVVIQVREAKDAL